jgi:hypothetical protein
MATSTSLLPPLYPTFHLPGITDLLAFKSKKKSFNIRPERKSKKLPKNFLFQILCMQKSSFLRVSLAAFFSSVKKTIFLSENYLKV